MASDDFCFRVQDHGTALTEKKNRVRCNHCGKEISGFSRLKCHLAGFRLNVASCLQVPPNIREAFYNQIAEKKRGNLSQEVGEYCSSNIPSRRDMLLLTDSAKSCDPALTRASGMGSEKRLKTGSSSGNHGTVSVALTKARLDSQSAVSTQVFSDREFQKKVGRFFYEAGIDLDAVTCPSFRMMLNAHFGSEDIAYPIPSCEDLSGWILRESVEEMELYVREIKSSWSSTGCSILLDGWEDLTGRRLVNVLVACPKGTVYLRSADISGFDQEIGCMLGFLDDVLKEVDVQNVVQIITCSTSSWMKTVGQQVMEKYKTVFWTVCALHCLELTLKKMGAIDAVKATLDKAKSITRFVHRDATILKVLRDHTSAKYLVRPSKFKLTEPFLTLENLLFLQEKLQQMFLSTAWKTTRYASSVEGKRVAELLADSSFWTGVEMAVKATIPLVRVIELIAKNSEPQVGFIYETMDQAKETIKEELDDKESIYLPFWKAIDDIWDGSLHSPLHAAGYFLNPKYFYTNDFYADSEVLNGLLCCIVRLAEDPRLQGVINSQIEEYRGAKGPFGLGLAHLQSSPGSWWLDYGHGCPQLQHFAVRILSQTCSGAARYNLKRSLAEKLLNKGRNPIEQERLAAMVFVHCNLQLQNFNQGIASDFGTAAIDPMDDWVVDKAPPVVSQNNEEGKELTWKELECGNIIGGRGEGDPGPSNFH
ncbi:uncharacterized protein [Coffea arabica]|uniref:DUF659 domain-containing protein n=1 Tax=Coffea arabica TaxID=13443 RepID=A0A6P6UY20_COFAR